MQSHLSNKWFVLVHNKIRCWYSLCLLIFQVSLQLEDGSDQTHNIHHDNGVCVRHIVTEIEAICHPASCLPASSSSSLSPSPQSPHFIHLEHPEDPEESEVTSLTSPLSAAPCEWPAGSVRRATEQLEQKLRQEMEMAASQRSPPHSPSLECPPVRLPLCSMSTEQPPITSFMDSTEQRVTQGETAAVSAESKDEETYTESQREHQRLNSSGTDKLPDPSCSSLSNISQVSGAIPNVTHTPTGSHTLKSSPLESSLDTSAWSPSQNKQCQTPPQASSNLAPLAGVTIQESDTDSELEPGFQSTKWGCGPNCEGQIRLTRGSQELERIQQTLRELQAFLHDGISLEVPDGEVQELGQPQMDTQPGPCKGEPTAQRLQKRQDQKGLEEPTGWHRATELEARIRQAGLTPPSLMKRSASLAKLDCLELSATDLNDLDLRPHTRTTSTHSQDSFSFSPDDTWKKQKVLAQNKMALPHGDPSSPSSRCPSASAPRHNPKEDTGEREEPDGSRSGLVPATRQQGRTQVSRRRKAAEKKQRGVTVLYNTM